MLKIRIRQILVETTIEITRDAHYHSNCCAYNAIPLEKSEKKSP